MFLKLSKSMIVNSYSSTSASVPCGRGGYVGILYTKYFSWSCLVKTLWILKSCTFFNKLRHIFMEWFLVLFGMLANWSVKWFLDPFCTFEINDAAWWIILYQKKKKNLEIAACN